MITTHDILVMGMFSLGILTYQGVKALLKRKYK